MFKQEARKVFMQKRRQLSATELKAFSNMINKNFKSFIPEQVKAVHVYLPIESKNEVDTWPLIKDLWAKEKRVAVPVVDTNKQKIISCELTSTTKLLENYWKVPEPVVRKKFDENLLDMVLIPLLAIDSMGFRVGYGKGFYDRFLKTLNDKVLKIGLSYFQPIDRISDIDHWDIAMDYCITPSEIIRF
jgi:5-formyltetrahydrofolate cyclo-ligase